jgi:hypothetical protein
LTYHKRSVVRRPSQLGKTRLDCSQRGLSVGYGVRRAPILRVLQSRTEPYIADLVFRKDRASTVQLTTRVRVRSIIEHPLFVFFADCRELLHVMCSSPL